jgi:hypothetical protein
MEAQPRELLMGWTLEQWAAAAAYWKRFEPLPAKDLTGAQKVRAKWLSSWPHKPGDACLIGVSHEREWGWAADTLHRVAIDLRNSLFTR